MGFIHMNGRVYDPSIGRFLSADPNIQAPYNAQSYNRYSYVLNNPLKYTYPSGFFLRKMFELSDKISKRFSPIGYAIQRSIEKAMMKNSTLRAIGMIAASAFGGPAGAAAFSARMACLSGGNDGDIFKAAAVSFASASAAGYIGHGGVDGAPIVEGATNKAIAHGLAQGAISQISGGNFQDGFIGGFIGSVAGSSMGKGGDWSDIAGRTAIAATAGGITAELGGGKFSNGMRSVAFVHLFNHEGGNISKALKTNNVANGKVEGGGSLFLGVGGVSASVSEGLDANGNMCTIVTACIQFGLGFFVGGGFGAEGGYDQPLTTGRNQSWGLFLNEDPCIKLKNPTKNHKSTLKTLCKH
ncbi:hypothetical protein BGC33_03690 [Bathymodiolus thermophilus thioautotrophic gill symbiont]|uniref:RHS repeat-associated core domain-containing protein n=2 Tax=Bathymodiolus thermophilus thioautotrophic gill symbiont TaxID=2360 RepID=A0A1J5UJL0_9GAMM|nr:hypothetical protein BGC33_03690 [Bathymodiolus thermophilus thioautotrophic gill symbiont]